MIKVGCCGFPTNHATSSRTFPVVEIKRSQREFDIDPQEPVYVIGVVSRLVRPPTWTLRTLDREGLVRPKRRVGRARLYCLKDVQRLVRIRRLIIDEGVNIQGVRVIMRMESTRITTS